MRKSRFVGFVFLYAAAVLYLAITTPISPHEAKLYYTSDDITAHLMHWGYALVPSFFGLRLFFVSMAFVSVYIFFVLAESYLSREEDAYLATVIFMFLPGFVTASVLANIEIIVLSIVLLFVLMYRKKFVVGLPIAMFALFFLHDTAIIFFIALLFYTVAHREKWLSILSLAFIIASLILSKGIEIGGRPSGHFVEIFGLYATIFSPLLFLYFFYTMYRIFLRGEKTLLWYISFTALIVSLLLSLRQEVSVTDFAPYVLISTIAMVDVFNHSYRVRLPRFRTPYKAAFGVALLFLVVTDAMILGSRILYDISDHPATHFAARIYEPYDLAVSLKKKHVSCYDTFGRKYYQLRFYGIDACTRK